MGSNYEDIELPIISPLQAEDNACLSAMLLCCSPVVYTAVLNAALELNLFETIAKATPPFDVSASEIASQLPTTQHPQLPRRIECCVFLQFTLFSIVPHALMKMVALKECMSYHWLVNTLLVMRMVVLWLYSQHLWVTEHSSMLCK